MRSIERERCCSNRWKWVGQAAKGSKLLEREAEKSMNVYLRHFAVNAPDRESDQCNCSEEARRENKLWLRSEPSGKRMWEPELRQQCSKES